MRSAMRSVIVVVGMSGAVLVAACGDDGNQPDFCSDGATTLNALGTLDVDPASNQFEEAVNVLESVDPPAAIADDWTAVVETLALLGDVESIDPETLADLNQRFAELDDARARIDQYIREECGTDAGDPDD
jgi:hypothetical protein